MNNVNPSGFAKKKEFTKSILYLFFDKFEPCNLSTDIFVEVKDCHFWRQIDRFDYTM